MRNRRVIVGVFLGAMLVLGIGSVSGGLPRTFPYSLSSFVWMVRSKPEIYRVNVGSAAAIQSFENVSKGIWIKNESATESLRLCDDPTSYTPTSTLGILLDAGESWSHPNWATQSVSFIRTGSSDLSATIRPEYHVE